MAAALTLSAMTARADDSATAIMEHCVASLSKPAASNISFSIMGDGAMQPGSLTFSGKSFRMETPQVSIWFDGKTQWTYLKANNEVNITEPTEAEISESNPFELIRSYGTDFRCRKVRTTPTADIIELTPKHTGAGYSNVILTVNKSNGLPSAMEIKFSNGTISDIKIKSITAVSPQNGLFTFPAKAYPGVETVDLR